jgi:hypothetical protein
VVRRSKEFVPSNRRIFCVGNVGATSSDTQLLRLNRFKEITRYEEDDGLVNFGMVSSGKAELILTAAHFILSRAGSRSAVIVRISSIPSSMDGGSRRFAVRSIAGTGIGFLSLR